MKWGLPVFGAAALALSGHLAQCAYEQETLDSEDVVQQEVLSDVKPHAGQLVIEASTSNDGTNDVECKDRKDKAACNGAKCGWFPWSHACQDCSSLASSCHLYEGCFPKEEREWWPECEYKADAEELKSKACAGLATNIRRDKDKCVKSSYRCGWTPGRMGMGGKCVTCSSITESQEKCRQHWGCVVQVKDQNETNWICRKRAGECSKVNTWEQCTSLIDKCGWWVQKDGPCTECEALSKEICAAYQGCRLKHERSCQQDRCAYKSKNNDGCLKVSGCGWHQRDCATCSWLSGEECKNYEGCIFTDGQGCQYDPYAFDSRKALKACNKLTTPFCYKENACGWQKTQKATSGTCKPCTLIELEDCFNFSGCYVYEGKCRGIGVGSGDCDDKTQSECDTGSAQCGWTSNGICKDCSSVLRWEGECKYYPTCELWRDQCVGTNHRLNTIAANASTSGGA